MEAAIFIARIFGIFYLVVGTGIMLNRRFYRKFMEDYFKNTALVFFSGIFALIGGTVIVLLHNVWVAGWPVIVTIIGWAALIKGVWIIVFPDSVSKFMAAYRENENLLMIHAAAALILGAILTFFGFFCGTSC